MDQNAGPIKHRVRVPIDGMTVAEARARVKELGLDPNSREARLVAVEQAEPEWEAVVTFDVGASGAVATGVEVRSTCGRPVSRAVWDRVRVAEVIAEAAAMVAWLGPITRQPERAAPFRDSQRPRGPGRPPEYDDEHYRRVGQVYMAAREAGLAPVRAVARAFEDSGRFRELTAPTDRRARYWVRAARARGYIGTPKDGDQT